MAWRPHEFLINGELDNTTLGKVTGWMRFAGLDYKVTFELEGDFHRDIRGARIRLRGNGRKDDPEAKVCMEGLAPSQTGAVGDITAGLPPRDYVDYPYIEWYSDRNGRVVLELEPNQLEVIGTPIPACESDPISREQQARNMAGFLTGLSMDLGVPAIAIGGQTPVVSDPKFTHWVVEGQQIVGEAHSVEPQGSGLSFAFVRLFNVPEMAEFGSIESAKLRGKSGAPHG